MRSKFRWTSIITVFIFLGATAILSLILWLLLNYSNPPAAAWVFLIVFLIVWLWIFFSELRLKANTIRVGPTGLLIRNYMGLGLQKKYSFTDIQDIRTSMGSSRYGNYEYLFLVRHDKPLHCISEFYHANYQDLKNLLLSRLPNLGHKHLTMTSEIKAIFR